MDEETRQAFANLMQMMNDQHERLLEALGSHSRDFRNTKEFLIDDALTLGRRMSAVEKRLDDLEKRG